MDPHLPATRWWPALVILIAAVAGEAQDSAAPAPRWTQAEMDRGYVVFSHNTLLDLEPDHLPSRESIVADVSCSLAQGEHRSLRLGVHALGADLSDVRLALESDLSARIYRPVDEETRRLLAAQGVPARVQAPGADYANGRSPHTTIDLQRACLDESAVLATVAKGTTHWFWLTLHAPAGASAGRHEGRIRIQPAGRPATELDLAVTVRPYALQRARIAFGSWLYYVDFQRQSYMPIFAQNVRWFGAIYRDMAEHSLTSSLGFGWGERSWAIDWAAGPPQGETLSALLPLAIETGLASPDVPLVLGAAPEPERRLNFDRRLTVAQKDEAAAWYEAQRQRQGWPELVDYARDEPLYPEQAALVRGESGGFRNVRMRLATAMNANAAYGLGDIHDIWIVFAGQVTAEMCREARRMGAEVWSYSCRMYAAEPLRMRHLAGLYTWAYELRGQTIWHHCANDYYKHVWMRESDQRPMPMVGWETRREGIDDYRYLQMLEDCVHADPAAPLAAEASRWLEELRARVAPVDPHGVAPGQPLAVDEYDRIRERAADYIEQLGPVPAEQVRREPVTRLEDEAGPFRTRSLPECIAGLQSDDPALRRAAAWALYERGPAAAPAVPALVAMLDDAEVRMPAFRALEAIGPPSLPALPAVRVLLRHPDGFVRLGAAYVAAAIGVPALDALLEALRDDYAPVPYAVLRRLPALGADALPALPVLIELLDKATWEGGPELVLRAIAGLGPAAAPAAPRILEVGQRYLVSPGAWPVMDTWVDPLLAIGGGAQALPMLEEFTRQHGSDPAYPGQAVILHVRYRVREEPEDLRAMVALIGEEAAKPREAQAALILLERLGKRAALAAPWVRQLLDRPGLSADARQRLEAFLESAAGAE